MPLSDSLNLEVRIGTTFNALLSGGPNSTMSKYKRSILLSRRDDQVLRELYLAFGIPSDQYKRRANELGRLANAWNNITSRSDPPLDLLHYIVTQRKQKEKNWPTFGGNHKRLASMPDDFLSRFEWQCLVVVYLELLTPLQKGSDNLAYDEQLTANLAAEFYRRSGRVVLGNLLAAAIEVKRKRGEWVKIRRQGFDDIGEIA
jgi:hypothetical protein